MDYELTILPKADYLHATVTGQNSAENVAAYLKELLSECKRLNCRSVLVEERLEGPRLSTVDIFRIASEGSEDAFGELLAFAYVDINATDDNMKFAETVATNRALPVRVFSSVAEAEKWMLGRAAGNRKSVDDHL